MDWRVFLGPDLIPAATAFASFGFMRAVFVGAHDTAAGSRPCGQTLKVGGAFPVV